MIRWKDKEKKKTHVKEEGPKRGFSLSGWNENLPRKGATQVPWNAFSGQSLTYIVKMKTTTLANTKVGISHGTHCLKSLKSRSRVTGGFDDDDGDPRRGWTLTSTVVPPCGFLPPLMMMIFFLYPFEQRFQIFNTFC